MKIRIRSIPLLAGLTLLLGVAAAHAQTPTVIAALPYAITTGGTYVLNSDLNSSQTTGNLIEIKASNATLDLQNHYISAPANNTGQDTVGIYTKERSNVAVRNGTVTFCSIGIYSVGDGSATTNSVDHQVDNLRVTYCYGAGIYLSLDPAAGVTNCQVSQCGFNGAGTVFGIYANSAGVTVLGNVVSTVTGTNGYGVYTSVGSFVRQNAVSNAKTGISGGKYQDNLTANCTTSFSAGVDAGGNN